MENNTLIQQCRQGDRKAQKQLYELYSSTMFSICKRYLKVDTQAEDALMEGFYKILSKIDQYTFKGSFEGWMKRIIVNECLMIIRKNKNIHLKVENYQIEIKDVVTVEDRLAYEDILSLFKYLPTGYRTVFNLYAIEGYKHREIADMLGISINTSKSQYLLAKKKLQNLIKKKHLNKAN